MIRKGLGMQLEKVSLSFSTFAIYVPIGKIKKNCSENAPLEYTLVSRTNSLTFANK